MTLVLNDAEVAAALDPTGLVAAIEHAIVSEPADPATVTERQNLAGAGRFLRVMPAVVPNSKVMGLKTFFGGGGVGVRYVILLMSTETGEVLSVMDACHLTAARTAATSVIGSRAMGAKATVLGILGSGLEAEVHARTFVAMGGVERIKVFSPNPDNRQRFAERLRSELGVDVQPVEHGSEVARDVDQLITATNTGYGGPIACHADWLGEVVHVTAIGSTHHELRELETSILHRADALVFDADATQIAAESGDIQAFVGEGGDLSTVVQLDALLQDPGKAPLPSGDLTIFKSVGTALQDLVAAEIAFRRAAELGLGERMPALAEPKTRR